MNRPDPTTITSLRSRIEALTGPEGLTYALFAEVATALVGADWEWKRVDGYANPVLSRLHKLAHAEAWVDAALALVACVLPGWTYMLDSSEGLASLFAPDWPVGRSADGSAKHMPNAILLALLTAMESRPNG